MLEIATHKTFIKDVKKAQLNPSNTAKLFMFIALLLNEEDLPGESRNHQLLGKYSDTKEFHISGDLLVIYKINGSTLELLRIGTHSQLFK